MTAAADLRGLIFGFRLSQAVHVAAALNLSDLLADGPQAGADLAARTGCDEGALERLLRALAAAGVYREEPLGTFANTAMGEALRTDGPGSLRDVAASIGNATTWSGWGGHLGASVRTGRSAFDLLHGMSGFEYRKGHLDESAAFDANMAANSLLVADAVVAAYELDDAATVLDVGGGLGVMLAAVLRANPGCDGIVFDQPHVVAGATEPLAAAGLLDRCSLVGGSFFEAVPSGADVYLLKSVLHDWADDLAVSILRQCRKAMTPDTTCLVVERVMEGPNEGLGAKLSDLNRLVLPGGQERTLDEYERLLAAADLRLTRSVPTSTEFHVIEAVAS